MLDRAATIVRDVRDWLTKPVDEDVITCLELLLDGRSKWLDVPDPTLWRTGDAHRLLIDTAAPRLTTRYGMDVHGPAALRTLIDYLDETDRFHPSSMRAVTLRKELDRAASRFPAAMADESVWRLAKRVFTAMHDEGVDIEDAAVVEVWAKAFATAPASRRQAVFGVLADRQPELLTAQIVIRGSQVAAIQAGAQIPPDLFGDDTPPPPQPPISLPPAAELAAAARESALLHRIVACGRWAAAGRKVNKRGFPSAADTRSFGEAFGIRVRDDVREPRHQVPLIRAWRIALEAEVLRLHRTEVVAGPMLAELERVVAGDSDPEATLRVWKEILDAAVLHADPADHEDEEDLEMAEFCRPWTPRALGELYRLQGEADLAELVDDLIDTYEGSDLPDNLAVMIGGAVRGGLVAVSQAGAAVVTTPPDADLEHGLRAEPTLGEPAWALLPVPGTRVTLTALGRYFVRENLLAEGTDAPLLPAGS